MSEKDTVHGDEPDTERESTRRGAQPTGDDAPAGDRDAEALAAQVELLADENRRLRAEYARAKRSQYRKTAAGLALLGAVAALAGVAVPAGRDVLFVLGATGLFGGLLTYYLTPERFVAASVSDRVFGASAANYAALIDELGLRDERYYLPGAAGTGPRVFVPQRTVHEFPDRRDGPVVTDDASRGLLLEPTGGALYGAFADTAAEAEASAPASLAAQLADAVVEQFELARSVEPDVAADRVTFAVADAAFGPLDRFDHPIPSLLAVGLATGLDRPVELTVDPGDDRADWLVTCRWTDAADEPAAPEE